MLCSIIIDMVNRQKLWLIFTAARALMPVMIKNDFLPFFVISFSNFLASFARARIFLSMISCELFGISLLICLLIFPPRCCPALNAVGSIIAFTALYLAIHGKLLAFTALCAFADQR